eukprot:6854504-Pyramimonas_sp.AAC.2
MEELEGHYQALSRPLQALSRYMPPPLKPLVRFAGICPVLPPSTGVHPLLEDNNQLCRLAQGRPHIQKCHRRAVAGGLSFDYRGAVHLSSYQLPLRLCASRLECCLPRCLISKTRSVGQSAPASFPDFCWASAVVDFTSVAVPESSGRFRGGQGGSCQGVLAPLLGLIGRPLYGAFVRVEIADTPEEPVVRTRCIHNS